MHVDQFRPDRDFFQIPADFKCLAYREMLQCRRNLSVQRLFRRDPDAAIAGFLLLNEKRRLRLDRRQPECGGSETTGFRSGNPFISVEFPALHRHAVQSEAE